MIENATLISIATPTSSPAGRLTFGTATALSARCLVGPVSSQQIRQLGAKIESATAQLTILKSRLGSTGPADGQKAVVKIDGGASVNYVIVAVAGWTKAGGVSNVQMFLRELRT